MTIGPGKYDAEASTAREATKAADGVLLIVLNGKRGSGFSAHLSEGVAHSIPALLRRVADEIESDLPPL